ncbi:MAG: RelA/SpoT family protein [Candidatus Nomurabacteria bacterium]|jgi:GTP pyrophosphokinase|nr:RelA/SpoT family protein [Candidatus Nomurabacteria bacterium]
MNRTILMEKAGDAFSKDQLAKLEAAVAFATDCHTGQKRRSGERYVVHPLTVAGFLIDWGLDIDSVVAGALHDVVEDCDVKLSEIKQRFGEQVAFLVDGVTKLGKVRAGMQDIDTYLPKTKDNLTKLLIATGADVRVIIIKLADRLHNLQTLSSLPPEKQRKIARESLEVFAPLADRLNMGQVRVQIEELSFSFLDPTRFNYLRKQIKSRLGRASKKLDHIREEVKAILKKNHIKFEMDGRVKSIYSFHKKLAKHNQNIESIYDIIALRIVVKDKPTCYQVLGLIHHLYTPMINRIKDYIAVPKQNGYQSLHTTVITRDEHIVEFQIRTAEMHEYAEKGLAASFHYNEQKLTDAYKTGRIARLPAELNWIFELQTAAAQLKAGQKVDMKKMRLHLFSDKIFVYTPKGDIFELPEGSMPLDFAYRVHTDIGKNAIGFKINGRISKANTRLKTGDVVEILTSPKTKPTIDWLDRVISPFARNKIRAALRQQGTKTLSSPANPPKKPS